MIDVCPYCDSARIAVTNRGSMSGVRAEGDYRCDDCNRSFDTPDTRERKRNTPDAIGSETVSDLVDAEPGEWP